MQFTVVSPVSSFQLPVTPLLPIDAAYDPDASPQVGGSGPQARSPYACCGTHIPVRIMLRCSLCVSCASVLWCRY